MMKKLYAVYIVPIPDDTFPNLSLFTILHPAHNDYRLVQYHKISCTQDQLGGGAGSGWSPKVRDVKKLDFVPWKCIKIRKIKS